MQFPTVTFVVFFGVVLTGAWTLHGHVRLRKLWLIAAGGWFYAAWDPRFVALLAGVVVATWGGGHLVARTEGRRRAAIMAAGIAADLTLLGFFKYYDFFAASVTTWFARLGVHAAPPLLQVALPVGVSFFTFQAISYLVDVRRNRVAAASLVDIAAWLTFFPTVTSGPITRAGEFVPQLARPLRPVRADLARAYWLIGRGLLKKLVLASYLATAITDKAFADPSSYSALTLLVAVYAYAAQIYCDFSGYTDLAIGIGRLLGFVLPENFDRPYTAVSVQDFWSRWHMTLSRWLRDYLYVPFAGRAPYRPARVYASLVSVMLIAGLWHGAAWGFVVFGGVHGVAMAIERARRDRRRRLRRPPRPRTWRTQLVARVVTFHVVCLGWVFFGTHTLGRATDVLTGIVTNWGRPITALTPLLVMAVAATIASQFLPRPRTDRLFGWVAGLHPLAQGAAFALALVPVLAMGPTTVPAFIYYRF